MSNVIMCDSCKKIVDPMCCVRLVEHDVRPNCETDAWVKSKIDLCKDCYKNFKKEIKHENV